jgi:hypothetical protein
MSFSVNVNKVDGVNVANFLISISPDMLIRPMKSIDGLSSGAALIYINNFDNAATSSALPLVTEYELVETFAAVEALLTAGAVASVSLASPTFTGTPVAPTAATATSTTQVATTAFVQANFTAKLAKLSTTALVAGSSGAIANALITANSSVTVTRLTQGGTFAPGGYQVALNAGVGYTITARKVDGTLENACTDTVCATIVY